MTLTEFLLARIAEDGTFEEEQHPIFDGTSHEPYKVHVERVAPSARALAEARAKAALVALHFEMDGGDPESYPYIAVGGRAIWPGCAVCDEGSPSRPHCDTVRILATIYADHPDYDEAWRP